MARRLVHPDPLDAAPSSFARLLAAAERTCPRGHADTLTRLLALALVEVPARGVFDFGIRPEPDLFDAVEHAAASLGLPATRARWRAALDAADLPLPRRDDVESAATELQTVSDSAYYYAGLAFGLVYAGPRGR